MEVYVSDTDVIDEVNEVYATQVSAYAISINNIIIIITKMLINNNYYFV